MITQLDAQIGRLLDKLDELRLSDNTLVIFVGDHGYSLGSHGFVGKQCMYDEGIRTPLVMRYPRWKRPARTNNALVSLVDLFPTICATAQIDVPASVAGASLAQLYQGRTEPARFRNQVFSAFHSPDRHRMSTRCIRTPALQVCAAPVDQRRGTVRSRSRSWRAQESRGRRRGRRSSSTASRAAGGLGRRHSAGRAEPVGQKYPTYGKLAHYQ